MDAPLLASFAAGRFQEQAPHGLKNPLRNQALGIAGDGYACCELGCGAGFCLLPLLHLAPELRGIGIDASKELTDACLANAQTVGLASRLHAFAARAEDLPARVPRPCCDMVVFNPPYWETGAGKACPTALSDLACRGNNVLGSFAKAAAALLVNHGHLFCIYPASRLAHLVSTLCAFRLGIRALRFVRSGEDEPAIRVLCEARKGMKSDSTILPDLVLYNPADETGHRSSTSQARAFCPWIR